jgi:hypothetical protein
MKRHAITLLTIFLLAAGSLPAMRVGQNASNADRRHRSLERRAAVTAAFASARKILFQKEVPFDADALLSQSWRVNLASTLAQMPEMETLRYEPAPLSGAYFADTLYLPEQITLAGDTVLLARQIVFEGSDVLIKGPHDVHLFSIEGIGVVGQRLADLPEPQFRQLTNLRTLDRRSTPLLSPAYARGRITIDTSGRGRTEWLNSTKATHSSNDISLLTTIDQSGTPGADGSNGTDAQPAANGGNGANGANGVCGTVTSVNGAPGSPGVDGTAGSNGGVGGSGNNGQNAGNITFTIPDGSSDDFIFLAKGGDGGDGGHGGNGGRGGNGGTGGRGGNGVDCACAQGGPGDGGLGGLGGNGGKGGDGGNGGHGGNGGAGGTISITYPSDFTGTMGFNSAGGLRGAGGAGGLVGGTGGSPGTGGGGGTGATNANCPSQTSVNGSNSPSGNVGVTGVPGTKGTKGTPGSNGSATTTRIGGADNDGDGYSVEQGDCDDTDPDVSPGSYEGYIYPPGGGIDCELCSDGIDNNCDGHFDLTDGGCSLCNPSPLVFDLAGDGLNLTSPQNGAIFDVTASNLFVRYAWIQGDDAWLVFDRNGNGVIDNGSELFGNATLLRSGERADNGFQVLAEYDADGDGLITANDPIYNQLRLWQDKNHNGTSEANELLTLPSKSVGAIEVAYVETKRRDEFGNRLHFRAHYYKKAAKLNKPKLVYDVFLTFENP